MQYSKELIVLEEGISKHLCPACIKDAEFLMFLIHSTQNVLITDRKKIKLYFLSCVSSYINVWRLGYKSNRYDEFSFR